MEVVDPGMLRTILEGVRQTAKTLSYDILLRDHGSNNL
jgi:hypothetical protein